MLFEADTITRSCVDKNFSIMEVVSTQLDLFYDLQITTLVDQPGPFCSTEWQMLSES
jgi:hypothetical protein